MVWVGYIENMSAALALAPEFEPTATSLDELTSFVDQVLAGEVWGFSLNHHGWQIVLTSSVPEHGCCDHPIDVPVFTWTAEVVSPYKASDRFQIAVETGLWIMGEARREQYKARGALVPPTVADHTKARLERMVKHVARYIELLERLTVMVEAARVALPIDASPKTRKQLVTAGIDLQCGRIVSNGRGSALIVAGETVFLASNYRKDEWLELVYEIGDEAVCHTYNLATIGRIAAVSPKTIKVVPEHGGKVRMLKHTEFLGYNDRPIAAAHRRNAEWMD